MECIFYPEQYTVIFRISFLALGSSMYAAYNGDYDFAICSGSVFLTSINYWRKPIYCWRRSLDVAVVRLVLMYQIYHGYSSEYMAQYYTLTFFAIGCYPLGCYYYNKNLYWHATYAHCAVHLFGNIANLVLYSGRNNPMK